MLLRVIDNSAAENAEDKLRIVLEKEDGAESFVTESYSSPISVNFRKTLAWYFSDYLQHDMSDSGDSGVVEKLIKFGQYMGDEFLGEDHQLIRLIDQIEENGYENLHVQIESTRIEFFDELWEIAILHESKYVLSAVAKSYVRQFVQADFPKDYPELHYDLEVDSAALGDISKLLQGDTASRAQTANEPVNILTLVSRPEAFNLPFRSSNSINRSLEAIRAGGSINYELHQTIDWQQLRDRFADKSRPVHILHYDGPVVVLADGEPNIVLENTSAGGSLVNVNELCKELVGNKVGALSIDARVYLQNDQLQDCQAVSALQGLATIAQCAHRQGLGNVIGLGQITNPWVSGQCFEVVYSQFAKGFSLEQAVVEARKALQTAIETSLLTIRSIPFHPWPLLVHYSRQSVTFFASPQILRGPDAPQDSELFRSKLFGFRMQMLPPLLSQVSDGQALPLIDRLAVAQQSGTAQGVSIIGEPGTGKSQLAHVVSLYLAEKQQIDFGFYFDFCSNDYSPDDMLEMIAPLLELKADQKNEVKDELAKLHCCFVLDEIVCGDCDQAEELQESWKALSQFFRTLISNGHKVIVIGESYSPLHDLGVIKFRTTPLPLIEQKMIAVDSLRRIYSGDQKLVQIEQGGAWDSLLKSVDGHPWLTKKLMPQLLSTGVSQLRLAVEQHIVGKHQGSKIERFYNWQWVTLKRVWQRLLILCSDVPGLLLEMLMTACDQKEPFAPAKSLFALLGDADAKFSEGLEVWEQCGFLSDFPHGRMVDSRCFSFLQTQREAGCFDDIQQQELQLYFSQIICEGIRVLAQHLVSQPNPSISNNLLLNRRYWVKHFENLWFGQDYRGFIGVKGAFEQLLRQAKLESESKDWSLDLLERSPVTENDNEVSIDAKLSWLALASSTLSLPKAGHNRRILEGVEIWRGWFDSLLESLDKQQLVLFGQVATFLENFYQSQSNWNGCIAICDKACVIYTQYKAWQRVIHSLKSLARYHFELGEKDQALVFENRIINDIPYAGSPPGFETQQNVDIVLARLSRGDTQHAQILLDQLRKGEEADKLAEMFDGIQCQIHYQEEDYLAALPYYCKVWTPALQSGQRDKILQLKARLMELEEKLGVALFYEKFEREVPEGTLKPKDVVIN